MKFLPSLLLLFLSQILTAQTVANNDLEEYNYFYSDTANGEFAYFEQIICIAPQANCEDVTIELESSGSYTLSAGEIDAGSCNSVSIPSSSS